MRILFLSRWFPFPPNNGSKLRVYNLLRGLATEHNLSLLSFIDRANTDINISEIHTIGRDVQIVPWKEFTPDSTKARLGFLSTTPRSIIDSYSPEMAQSIDQVIVKKTYDLVIASQIDTAVYRRHFRDLPALFEEVEVGVLYDRFANAKSVQQRLRHWLTWKKYSRYLYRLLQDFQACTVVSKREHNLLHSIVTDATDINVIPNCISLDDYKQVETTLFSNTLIFTGSFRYFPNYEGIRWFIAEVYPRVQRQIPFVKLIITGDHADLPLPPADNTILTGYVEDVRPYIASSIASVVPIFQGGGTRIKILEAMALGTPVVSTLKGAEGLDVESGKHLLLTDSPKEFAEHVINLLQDSDLRKRLSSNALELMREKYDWAVIMPRFLGLVEKAALV